VNKKSTKVHDKYSKTEEAYKTDRRDFVIKIHIKCSELYKKKLQDYP
jgi:hypothetical protein